MSEKRLPLRIAKCKHGVIEVYGSLGRYVVAVGKSLGGKSVARQNCSRDLLRDNYPR